MNNLTKNKQYPYSFVTKRKINGKNRKVLVIRLSPTNEKIKILDSQRLKVYPDSKYNKSELEKGNIVEFEHTNEKATARKIAKQHLNEFDKYYVELDKMEEKLKQEKK